MPNPRKPNEIKRKTGNPGKRPLPQAMNVIALPMAQEPPEPPRPLGPEGMKLWIRVWEAGRAWISANSDVEHVLIMCETMDERSQLRLNVLRGADWRDRVALRSIDSQLTSMLSALGFNPIDRSRLGIAEVQAQSKIDQLLARRRGE
jgi:phage terminase small subunit